MATLAVSTSTDFSSGLLNNIDTIDFTNLTGTQVTAKFSSAQFGAGLISNTVVIDGSTGGNRILVEASGAFDASGWVFAGNTVDLKVELIELRGSNIIGSTRSDKIIGTAGNDTLRGGGGLDTMLGGAGIDTYLIHAGVMDDGGVINDTGSEFADVLAISSAGEFDLTRAKFDGLDELRFNAHGATVELSQNQDRDFSTLTGSSGADKLVIRGDDIDLTSLNVSGWSSSDRIELHAQGLLDGQWTIHGSEAGDHFFSGVNLGVVQLYGRDGFDVFHLGYALDYFEIDGGDDRDVLLATSSGDHDIYIIASVEVFEFGGSADQSVTCDLDPADGFDTVVGNSFANQIGHDVTVNADWSHLIFESWSNNDTVVLTGQEDANEIIGSQVADTIAGGSGADTLKGNDGADLIKGDSNKDTIGGGKGGDTIFGNKQNDTINGNKGGDVIDGGFGADTMTGGEGADVFVYKGARDSGLTSNQDLITDFEAGIDKIDLSALVITNFRGNDGLTGAPGQVGYLFDGDYTNVAVDIDGDGADFQFRLSGNIQLEVTDFILM